MQAREPPDSDEREYAADGSSGDDPVESILTACLDAPPSGREEALESACRAHPVHAVELRERFQALRDMGLLGGTSPEADDAFPERLGEFRLERRLGGGGMGVVYLAVQEPLGREVALKLIRPEHLYFPRARERFRRETEAVARLQHPGIVPIYTVGEANGIPYFAMELVAGCTLAEVLRRLAGRAPESLEGVDLLRAIRASPTSGTEAPAEVPAVFARGWVEACLRLARQTAEALHHAHGRGVLHRDVKPSNVAVTPDGRAQLLDFGLASSADEARMTLTGSALGSLLYMSPEQVLGERVDERSDVYSLGVTLYELLTLQVPHHGTSPLDTRARILDGRCDPIRARNRSVPRDVETVCLKAMDPDAARRYATAADFARDLHNLLDVRPIEARPPSALDRSRRWVQRNPYKSAAAALAFVLLVGTPTSLLVLQHRHAAELQGQYDAAVAARQDADAQRERAQIEARDAKEVSDLLFDLFQSPDPEHTRGEDLRARDLLDRALTRIDEQLSGQPEVRARLLERIGESYVSLGLYREAAPLLERALAWRRGRYGEESVEVARAKLGLAEMLHAATRPGAIPLMREALATHERVLGCEHPETIDARIGLASALADARAPDEAFALFSECLEVVDRVPAVGRELRASILGNIAHAYNEKRSTDARNSEAAAAAAREACAIYREIHREPHPSLVWILNDLAVALRRLGHLDEAEEAYGEAMSLCALLYGEESDRFAIFEANVATLQEARGRLEEAALSYRSALERLQRTTGPDNEHAVTCLYRLAGLAWKKKDYPEARALYAQVLPILERHHGKPSAEVTNAREKIALASHALGDLEEAERGLRELVRDAAARGGERNRNLPRMRARLAGVLRRKPGSAAETGELVSQVLSAATERADLAPFVLEALACRGFLALEAGKTDVAEATFRNVVGLAGGEERDPWAEAAARSGLGACLTAAARLGEAEPLLVGGWRDLEARLGPTHVETLDALRRVVAFYEASSQPGKAQEHRAILEQRTAALKVSGRKG